jgi:hypothetical protein
MQVVMERVGWAARNVVDALRSVPPENRADQMAKFKPGQSGNPGGRPAVVKDIRELARRHTNEAVAALIKALDNQGERVPAAEVLLAYGYGRPQRTLNVRRITNWEDLDYSELAALAAADGKQADEDDGTRH